MTEQKHFFLMWICMASSNLAYTVSGQQKTIYHLSHNAAETTTVLNAVKHIYHVRAITSPAYVLGCTCIGVYHSSGDFELELQENLKNIGTDSSFWYQTLSSLSRWYSRKPNKSVGYSQTRCFSPYKEMYFTVKPNGKENGVLRISSSHMVLDLTCCICLISGLLFFYKAPQLSKSMTFYYTSGTGLGILASALILVFMLSRFLPKKPAAYTVLLGGWSLCAFILSRLWSNLTDVMINYYQYLIGYAFISGFISFGICYRYGTITNPRSHSLIQWAIQVVSLLLVYNGTQQMKVSLAIIMILLLHWTLPSRVEFKWNWGFNLSSKFKQIPGLKWVSRRYCQPSQRRLLTEEEYQLEGEVETQKALEELRAFCHSPQCSPWKTLSRIESPKRFAQFIEGDSHLLDAEITLHEETINDLSETEEEENIFARDFSFISEDDDSLEL